MWANREEIGRSLQRLINRFKYTKNISVICFIKYLLRLSNQTLALDMKLTQEEALSKRLEKYFDRHVNPVRWVDTLIKITS